MTNLLFSFSSFFILIVILNLKYICAYDIRLCKSNETTELLTSDCHNGIIFKSQDFRSNKDINCICMRGLWYVQPNFCSVNQNQNPSGQFILTKEGCFDQQSFNFGPSSSGLISPLTTFTNPLVLTSLNHGILFELKETNIPKTFTVHLGTVCNHVYKAPNLLVLRLKPNSTSWSVTRNNDSQSICLVPGNGIGNEIYYYNISELCTADTNDEVFHNKRVQTYLTFREECEYEDGNEWIDQIPESLHAFIIPESNSTACHKCSQALDISIKQNAEHDEEDEAYNCIPDDIYDRSELDYAIDLQSARIALYLQNRLLKPREYGNDYVSELAEIEFLRKASILAFGACNSTMIPKEFYQYFLIMFKALLMESIVNYPPQKFLERKSLQYIRLAVQKCLGRTTVYKIKLEEDSGECPGLFSSRMQTLKEAEVLIPFPEGFPSNPEIHDYLLEFTWKLSTFLFYHCYDDFESAPIHHYELREQLEAIFTEDLLIRWANPSNSLKMYKDLFSPHLDVEVAMKNFDKCVGAAHALSKYAPDIWLKRPLDRPSSGMNAYKKPNTCSKRFLEVSEQSQNGSESEWIPFTRIKLKTNQGGNQRFECIDNLQDYMQKNRIKLNDCV